MEAIQMQLNVLGKSDDELKYSLIQQQIDAINESVGKVRRKLFAELGEVKKQHALLMIEHQELKEKLRGSNGKVEYVYNQEGNLFLVREPEKAG